MANRAVQNDQIENDILSGVDGFEQEDVNLQQQQDDGADDVMDNEIEQGDVEQFQQQQPQVEQKQQRDPKQKDQQPQQRVDRNGNIIDSRGNIIAPAGRYRRIEEQNRRYKDLLDAANAKLTKSAQDLAAAQFLNGAPAKLGLSQDETAQALDMMHLFKTNPSQMVQLVLAEAASRGVDLNKLLGGSLPAINTDAITRMLDQRLRPLDDAARRQEAQQQAQSAAEERYNTFLSKYPDATSHADAIAELMKNQGLSEYEAYFRVREFAMVNGLDFNSPLGPQIRARMAAQRGQRQQPQQQRQRPMIRGDVPQNRQMVERQDQIASPNRSYGSIVEEAMAEAGYLS